MLNRVILKEKQVTENLHHKISLTKDQEQVFLNVDFMHGKYKIEKSFKNNFGGLSMLEIVCGKLSSDEKVIDYLNIGENDERIKP
jgi:hypothetical protein